MFSRSNPSHRSPVFASRCFRTAVGALSVRLTTRREELMSMRRWKVGLVAAWIVIGASLLVGCGNTGTKAPVPQIQNINTSTTPTSPVNLPIEINGSGFQSAPGKVVFTQGSVSDRKSTRLNSSHTVISYAVFCLKKKKNTKAGLPIQKKKTNKTRQITL